MNRSAPSVNTVQSVERAAELLKAVASAGEPETAPVLADRCGLNRSTTWRLLATLERHGLVDRDPETGRYSVGHAVVQMAGVSGYEALARRGQPLLRRLADDTGETVNLAVPHLLQLVYVSQVQAPHVMTANWLGRPVALHATSTGKAFLAWLPDEERAVTLAQPLECYTKTTLTDATALEAELRKVRRRGYAVSRGELEPGLSGVSAASLDERERPVAVVSVWGPESRIRAHGFRRLGEAAATSAQELAADLRWECQRRQLSRTRSTSSRTLSRASARSTPDISSSS
jgi:DNA-binding IclR family transcriptional regulator